MDHLADLEIADSQFLGFVFPIQTEEDARAKQGELKSQHPKAAHVAVVWRLGGGKSSGFDEDGEPPNSVGPPILRVMEENDANQQPSSVALVIVRYFGSQLLGVTCGRLSQCYESITRLTFHRYYSSSSVNNDRSDKDTPLIRDLSGSPLRSNLYGMGAGDCEVILNVLPDSPLLQGGEDDWFDRVKQELNFDGFRGAAGEVLPRLQNLQADLSQNLVPIYRYPGNYNGQEWDTFEWAPLSLQVKTAVEEALQPLVTQTMNHCVTNLYRDGNDFIAHHSDKDLDLNQSGVIVSVSLGDERILELRRRKAPHDIIRTRLPHCSMLVLGPKTNKQFTHSILPSPDGSAAPPRISLTLRECKTFLDLSSGRLFGQGVQLKTLEQVQAVHSRERLGWWGGLTCCALSVAGWVNTQKLNKPARGSKIIESPAGFLALFGLGAWGMIRYHWNMHTDQKKEEQSARASFSKASLSGTKY